MDFDGVPGYRPKKDESENQKSFEVAIGEDNRNLFELNKNFIQWTLTELTTKLISAPVIDAFGSSSWDVMLRHTDMLFHKEKECIHLLKKEQDKCLLRNNNQLNDGGLYFFLKELEEEINKDKNKENWEITLVGHSMGTIVANKIIREFGDDLPINKIIYLASADTVEHYQDTVFPFLKRSDAKIYHFVLHPRAEEGEKNPSAYIPDLAPRGSLLVWIDNFLAKPLSLQQRTIGRYDNLMRSLHDTPDELRGKIHIRVYSAGQDSNENNPLTHSEIAGLFKFWDDNCLELEPADAAKNCIVPVSKRDE